MRVKVQLRSVPILTPLSFIISLMYIQTIGPGPNSNAATKAKQKMSSPVNFPAIVKIPQRIMKTVQAPVAVSMRVLLPNLLSSGVEMITAAKLTPCIRAEA